MDFQYQLLHTFPGQIPLPLYMEYSGYRKPRAEQEIMKDMEYLQQVYPLEIKKYQKRIAEILDKTDYEGSMIYDEYPDFTTMRCMTDSMVTILRKEDDEDPTEREKSDKEWDWIRSIVQILLCDEIYKRRHGGMRGKIFWMH